MSTDSTTGVENALRTRLLTFSPLVGVPLADVLGRTDSGSGSDGKLFWDAAPDIASQGASRWAVMRLQNWVSGGDGQERELGELEVTLFARPRSQKVTLELCADLCHQAMLRYTEVTDQGIIACWGRKRSTMPPFASPADTEVVQIMLVYTLVLWPAYLTQYHDS